MKDHIYLGYARVSTAAQDYESQVSRLKEAGCSEVFAETVSGSRNAHSERFRDLFARVAELRKEGHEVTVLTTKIDRWTRSTSDFLAAIQELAELGASYRALDGGLSYTHGDATSKFTLTVFAALAELERDLIRSRTAEGRAARVAKGLRLGPKPKLRKAQVARIRSDYATGRFTPTELATLYGVGRSTILRVLSLYGYTDPYVCLEEWQTAKKKSAA